MTHVFFNPESLNWGPFLDDQQEGRGELQYFVGTKYQRGGGLLQNVARFLMPVAHNLLHTASKEGLEAGTRVLGDLAQGKALKESLQSHAKQGFENLASKIQQCGKGKKTKRKKDPKIKVSFHRKDNANAPDNFLYNPNTVKKKRRRRIIDQLSLEH